MQEALHGLDDTKQHVSSRLKPSAHATVLKSAHWHGMGISLRVCQVMDILKNDDRRVRPEDIP
jgi:hypothetical protein